jgi:hypothetical protein
VVAVGEGAEPSGETKAATAMMIILMMRVTKKMIWMGGQMRQQGQVAVAALAPLRRWMR